MGHLPLFGLFKCSGVEVVQQMVDNPTQTYHVGNSSCLVPPGFMIVTIPQSTGHRVDTKRSIL